MILAISALAGSGKDTVAQILVEDHGFVQVAFADVLKRILQDVYQFSDEQLWGPSECRNQQDERYPMEISFGDGEYRKIVDGVEGNTTPHCLSPRKALLILGDALRECYPHTVVDYGLRISDRLLTKPEGFEGYAYNRKHSLFPAGRRAKGVVFSDVRLWRELTRIREGGGKLIRVTRPGAGLKGEDGEHLTESEMATIGDGEFHHILVNDGSLDELRSKVANMVQGFGVLSRA
jgi:hypothetical protein